VGHGIPWKHPKIGPQTFFFKNVYPILEKVFALDIMYDNNYELTESPSPKPGAGLWSSAWPSLHLIWLATNIPHPIYFK